MNILLWVLQVLVAVYCAAGAAWRLSNYEVASKQVASIGALPYGAWSVLGAFEILCALALILPGALKVKPSLTWMAAAALAVEMLLVTGLHARYFGFELKATNPALWTAALAALAAFLAYARMALQPL